MQPDALPPGYRSTVGVLALTQTVSWAILYYAFSSFVLPMHQALNWPKATLMGALTVGLVVWGLATYAVGAAIDRGWGRQVMTSGSVLAGLACLAWGQVTQVWMLYAVCVAIGLACAMTLYEPAFALLTKRYPQHYRRAITTLTLVAGFASTVSFPVCGALIAALGWRDALTVLGAVLLLAVVPLQAWSLRGPALGSSPEKANAQDDATVREALRHPAFWLLCLAFMGVSFAASALWAHVMPLFAAKGFNAVQATAVLVWIGPLQVVGRLAFVGWGAGFSLRRMGAVVMACSTLAFGVLAMAHALPAMFVFAVLFGLANGVFTIVRGALVPLYFGRTHIGRISGAMAALGLVARAFAPWTAATALPLAGGYDGVIWGLCAVCGLALASYWAAGRPPHSAP
jgi:MFS family permease